MIKISFDEITKRIKEQTGLTADEIDKRIERKMEQLSGLISREGAAHIIANEMSIKLLDSGTSGSMKIKSIMPGMKGIETYGKVEQLYGMRAFNSNGREGKVASFLMADESSSIRVVLWNEQTGNLQNISPGSIVKITSAYAKDNNGRTELHINDKSQFMVNPKGVEVSIHTSTSKVAATRKDIKDLIHGDDNAEIVGTIVQVYSLRFFEVCPNCSRRVKVRGEDGFYCDEHAKVNPKYSYVMNLFVDDGTESIRVVLFKNQADKLLNKDAATMESFRESSDLFENSKNELIGNMVRLIGRAAKNSMFDRIEFVANLVFTDVKPEEEIKRLEKEIESKKSAMPKIEDI